VATGSLILWPFMVYFAAVILLAASMIGLSYLLGERHHEKATGEDQKISASALSFSWLDGVILAALALLVIWVGVYPAFVIGLIQRAMAGVT
jgi:NADH:ubiquinone oxidoreductase subunit 4 (subunit M)